MKNFNSVVWFEIYVNNMDRATKFYETVFDIKLESLPNPTDDPMEMKTFPGDMENHGSNGALVKMEGFEAGGNGTLVYFGSKDCTTEESRVEKAGGKIVKPKMSIGEYGFITLFFDTEGNMVGLHSME
ncbi:VOC family protein [Aureibaculum sp. 2210JD6-5]|uniref:VOC family protein n=1 Tax=Aureibaculum sp. 2210JD6-5 TaxID=3103957 RepID=UPI002AADAF0D|nr:VOC family protein [Aureibaculum sp. 2210JD6-5]MDY7396385.1 VOC family protein [Aureibaculum sp. 2210JD6-5]